MFSEENNHLDHARRGRHSIRLKGYDYTQPGGYFVTIVTFGRACLFGQIDAGELNLTPLGQVAQSCWLAIPEHFPFVELGAWVVMPNHVHGILMIHESENNGGLTQQSVGATHWVAPTTKRPNGPQKGSLGAIIGAYKMAVTRIAKRESGSKTVWQRNYYEHILRGQSDWEKISAYILDNPARWMDDSENPAKLR